MESIIPTLVNLKIDVRERALISELTSLGIPFTTEALDIGDILFCNSETKQPILIIERKTHADFASSNTDGRYREQRGRLLSARASGIAVLYFLEGRFNGESFGRVTEEQLQRLTTRLQLRYGLPMLFTESVNQTAKWTTLLFKQLCEDPTVFVPDSTAAATSAMDGFTSALTTAKKGNKTPAGTAHAMLSAVPGLGAKRIDSLLSVASIAELVAMSIEQIAEITVGETTVGITAGGKRLGPKLAETLYSSLHHKILL